MSKINILTSQLTNRIAAGQVVENPATVIKELVENSLDADATRIDIIIESGGVQLMRVSDNGTGMSPEDIRLSIERYATSKVKEINDLNHIHSFGFRGEALPSIAAISRFKIKSRQRGSVNGYELQLIGGEKGVGLEVPMSEGTVVEVKDLFFNTPARRKFLRTDSTLR